MVASTLRVLAPIRLRWILAAGVVAMLFFTQGVRGDSPRTVNVQVDLSNNGVFSLIPAPGHEALAQQGTPYLGDVFSGQAPILKDGSRVGSFYFMSVGTVPPGDDNFQNGSNSIFAVGRLELWGEGSIDVQGTVTFFGDSYLSITGGTGMYATATGQCTETAGDNAPDQFSCEVH